MECGFFFVNEIMSSNGDNIGSLVLTNTGLREVYQSICIVDLEMKKLKKKLNFSSNV